MQLYTDDHKDLRLLDLRGLTPLDADMLGGELDLMAMIAEHNDRSVRAAGRLRQLVEDRWRLNEFTAWERRDSGALHAERTRLRGENWDTLLKLRCVLEERTHVLTEIEQRLRERYDAAHREHHETVAAAERRLARERRELERAHPTTAGNHFADLVEDDASVQAAAQRNASSRRAVENVAESRRNLAADLRAIATRQREVFQALIV